METKKSIIKDNLKKYKKASKKVKTDMLNDLEKALHWHRKYIIMLLNRTGKVYYTPQGVKLVGEKAFILCNQNWLFNGIPKAILNDFPNAEQHDLHHSNKFPKQ